MWKVVVTLGMAGALGGAASAADKPIIGPAPAWVKPVALPPTPAKDDEAAIRLILSDEQVSLEPGQQTTYTAAVLKIQTPQGLAAGNISLPWRPDTDVLTVHKLLIRRGDQTIDVLASGQTFTVVRREQNLDSATLDGVLTANIQPEGLQVGDVLEFAASVTSRDPVMKGHVEQIGAAWNGFPMARAHLRMQWPNTIPARLRTTGSLPIAKPVKAGGYTSVDVSLDSVTPVTPPKSAPLRYRIGRLIELTDFASWADLSALMAPLYQKAAVLPAQGPLRVELDRIRAASPDPKVRTEAALALVQDRIRYVALVMGTGGLVPADAETTWARRFGDCKAKTALLLALLRELGVQAEPVLVSTVFGDGLDERLPMAGLFNHVLVRATIAGKPYWLDGTRTGDTSLDRITVPAFGWGLPVATAGGALVRMMPTPLDIPTQATTIQIDATAGLTAPAPTKVETILRGDDALGVNARLINLTGEARDRALRDYWKEQYDFITITSTNAVFDPKSGEQRLTMEGNARMDWSNGAYQTDGTNVGYRADFGRDPGPDKDAPFAVPFPYATRTQETILLPKGQGDFKLGTGLEVDQTVAGIQYRRHATIAGNAFTIEKTERSVVPEFPAKDAPAAQAALRTLADHPANLRKPLGYNATDREVAAARSDTPTTANEYGKRAGLFVDRGMRKEALADYTKAIALDPDDVWAWSNRAITRIQDGDIDGAKTDIAKAETLDPTYVQIFIGRGMLADLANRPHDAIDAYGKAIQREPDNAYALERRAAAYTAIGDEAHSLADLATAANDAVAANPDTASVLIDRGNVMLNSGRLDDAIKDFDRAIALDPKISVAFADRAIARVRQGDFAAATKDADVAYALDPKSTIVYHARGLIAEQTGAPGAAIAAYTAALRLEPGDTFALRRRAEALRNTGDDAGALRDAAAALKQKPDWIDLYLLRANILRQQGTRDQALAEADAVVAANPDKSYAHVVAASVYKALHEDAKALVHDDRAIAIRPEPYLYLNRSLHRPKEDRTARLTDLDAALKLDPAYFQASAAKAEIFADAGNLPGGIATYSAALTLAPANPSLQIGRGILYARSGNARKAELDFATARATLDQPMQLNDSCWAKAVAGVALASALADCNAALAKMPDMPAILDSRALVLLRLDRLDEARTDYDHALSKTPNLPTSLYGRGIIWARKGDTVRANADFTAALKIAEDIKAAFDRYGVKP